MQKSSQFILLLSILLLSIFGVQYLALGQAPTGDQVFLPLVSSSGEAATPEPTPVGFASDEFPQQGQCPTGFHLVDQTGGAGIAGDDVKAYSDAFFTCMPDDTTDLLACGDHGTAQVVEGVASCACQDGYAGEQCNICLAGFEKNSVGVCEAAAAPPTIDISSTFASLEAGQLLTLTASTTVSDAAGGPFTNFVWTLPDGAPGCLKTSPGDRCATLISNQTTIYYVAPDTIEELTMVQVKVAPSATVQSAAVAFTPPQQTQLSIGIAPTGGIPIVGSGDARLLPIVRAVRDFMHYRCVGAGVVGISYYGKPLGVWGLGRMDGRAELNAPADCGDDTVNPFKPNSALVLPNMPFRLGSVSKSVMAAVTRLAVEAQWKKFQPGVTVTQDMIEALPLLQGQAQVGKSLLPEDVVKYYNGTANLPWVISGELGKVADVRWKNATLGHMLAHRGGLPRSAPDDVTSVTPNLVLLRGLDSENDFIAEQNKLINQYGSTVVDGARTTLATALGVSKNDVYLLPATNLEEILIAVAGRVLSRAPGEAYEYSNTDPAYWLMIAENMTGMPFVAAQGNPASHSSSMLYELFKESVGVNTTGNSGIFVSQAIWPPVGIYTHANSRLWSNSGNTYYPLDWDRKHPHCIFGTTTCDFDSWVEPTGNGGRINYSWQLQQVPFSFLSTIQSPGTGSLLSDAKTFLAFMKKYWVSGYSANPRIGEKRNGQWNQSTIHNGSLGGGLTYAMQLGTDSGASFTLPARTNNGNTLSDGFKRAKVDQIRLDFAVDKLYITYDGQSPVTVDVVASSSDKVAIGYATTEGHQSIFHAQIADGKVAVRDTQGKLLYSFAAGFVAGASIALGNIDNDIFDEILIAKPTTGAVVIYQHDGTFLRQLILNIAAGDRLAVGDYNGNGSKDILIARSNGDVDVYPNNSTTKANTIKLGVGSNDGFAMGNVIGSGVSDEIVLGRKSNGRVEIYNWSSSDATQKLFTWFTPGYDTPAGLTIGRFNSTLQSILVGRLGTKQMNAYINVPDADKDGVNDYLVFKQEQLWSPLFTSDILFAGGHLSGGYTTYFCSSEDGTVKKMPAGVDIFLAINQTNTDRSCEVNNYDDDTGDCNAYDLLPNFALYGVCQVNWSTISIQDGVSIP